MCTQANHLTSCVVASIRRHHSKQSDLGSHMISKRGSIGLCNFLHSTRKSSVLFQNSSNRPKCFSKQLIGSQNISEPIMLFNSYPIQQVFVLLYNIAQPCMRLFEHYLLTKLFFSFYWDDFNALLYKLINFDFL